MDRDKADAVILNADVPLPVSAALVRRTLIDRADQLMQDTAIQLLDTDIGSRLFNEPFKMIVLCFLYAQKSYRSQCQKQKMTADGKNPPLAVNLAVAQVLANIT